MEIRIRAIRFDAAKQLEGFIRKKVSKLEQFYDGIISAEVVLKVIKPETAHNKQASIRLKIKNNDCFAEKANDSFEKAIDDAVVALEKQLVKIKKKTRSNNGAISDVVAILGDQIKDETEDIKIDE